MKRKMQVGAVAALVAAIAACHRTTSQTKDVLVDADAARVQFNQDFYNVKNFFKVSKEPNGTYLAYSWLRDFDRKVLTTGSKLHIGVQVKSSYTFQTENLRKDAILKLNIETGTQKQEDTATKAVLMPLTTDSGLEVGVVVLSKKDSRYSSADDFRGDVIVNQREFSSGVGISIDLCSGVYAKVCDLKVPIRLDASGNQVATLEIVPAGGPVLRTQVIEIIRTGSTLKLKLNHNGPQADAVRLTIQAKKPGSVAQEVSCEVQAMYVPPAYGICNLSQIIEKANDPLVVESLHIRDFDGSEVQFNRNGTSTLGSSNLPAFFGL